MAFGVLLPGIGQPEEMTIQVRAFVVLSDMVVDNEDVK